MGGCASRPPDCVILTSPEQIQAKLHAQAPAPAPPLPKPIKEENDPHKEKEKERSIHISNKSSATSIPTPTAAAAATATATATATTTTRSKRIPSIRSLKPSIRTCRNLFMAVRDGQKERVESILSREPHLIHVVMKCSFLDDVDVPVNALCVAAWCGKLEMVKYLVSLGSDPTPPYTNEEGQSCRSSALVLTILSRHPMSHRSTIVTHLLTHGCDVHTRVSFHHGMNAFEIACEKENVNVAEILLKYGANVDGKEPVSGLTPLIRAVRSSHDSVVRFLIEHGASLKRPDTDVRAMSLLEYGALMGSLSVVEALVESGAVDLSTWQWRSQHAQHLNIVSYLIGCGVPAPEYRLLAHFSVESSGSISITQMISDARDAVARGHDLLHQRGARVHREITRTTGLPSQLVQIIVNQLYRIRAVEMDKLGMCELCHKGLNEPCPACLHAAWSSECTIRRGPCHHAFHLHCIRTHLNLHPHQPETCPIDHLPWEYQEIVMHRIIPQLQPITPTPSISPIPTPRYFGYGRTPPPRSHLRYHPSQEEKTITSSPEHMSDIPSSPPSLAVIVTSASVESTADTIVPHPHDPSIFVCIPSTHLSTYDPITIWPRSPQRLLYLDPNSRHHVHVTHTDDASSELDFDENVKHGHRDSVSHHEETIDSATSDQPHSTHRSHHSHSSSDIPPPTDEVEDIPPVPLDSPRDIPPPPTDPLETADPSQTAEPIDPVIPVETVDIPLDTHPTATLTVHLSSVVNTPTPSPPSHERSLVHEEEPDIITQFHTSKSVTPATTPATSRRFIH